MYINTDERYGDNAAVTVEDYLSLNPDGEFRQDDDGIYEQVDGRWQQIAAPKLYAYWTQYSASGRPDRPVVSTEHPAEADAMLAHFGNYIIVYEGTDEAAAQAALDAAVYEADGGWLHFA